MPAYLSAMGSVIGAMIGDRQGHQLQGYNNRHNNKPNGGNQTVRASLADGIIESPAINAYRERGGIMAATS